METTVPKSRYLTTPPYDHLTPKGIPVTVWTTHAATVNQIASCSAPAIRVMILIVSCLDKTGFADVDVPTLRERMNGVSTSLVNEALRELINHNWVQRKAPTGGFWVNPKLAHLVYLPAY